MKALRIDDYHFGPYLVHSSGLSPRASLFDNGSDVADYSPMSRDHTLEQDEGSMSTNMPRLELWIALAKVLSARLSVGRQPSSAAGTVWYQVHTLQMTLRPKSSKVACEFLNARLQMQVVDSGCCLGYSSRSLVGRVYNVLYIHPASRRFFGLELLNIQSKQCQHYFFGVQNSTVARSAVESPKTTLDLRI